MKKRLYAFSFGAIMTFSAFAGPTDLDCQSSTTDFDKNLNELENVSNQVEKCPKPTSDHFLKVCNSIDEKLDPKDDEKFIYRFQEDLWSMSCAKPGKDTPDQAKKKIQEMWNTYRSEFKCPGNTTNAIHNANVTKYAMDDGFPTFVSTAIKKYELDMNFIDPKDGKTLLDYVEEQLDMWKKTSFTSKANEFQRIYDLLTSTGAKRAKDLK